MTNAGTGNGLLIDQNGNGVALNIDSEATSANIIQLTNEGEGYGVFIDQNGNGEGVYIDNDGTEPSIYVAGTAGNEALYISHNATSAGTYIVDINTGVGSGGLDSTGNFIRLTDGGNLRFQFKGDGNATCDGSWAGSGADYAEWFEKEGEVKEKDVIGLNLETGKVRKYENGDVLVGVYSSDPGFIGNSEADDDGLDEDNALVALVGQVDIDEEQVRIDGRKVSTLDGVQIGYLLNNGKVFLKN
jgi:hypothetical protein